MNSLQTVCKEQDVDVYKVWHLSLTAKIPCSTNTFLWYSLSDMSPMYSLSDMSPMYSLSDMSPMYSLSGMSQMLHPSPPCLSSTITYTLLSFLALYRYCFVPWKLFFVIVQEGPGIIQIFWALSPSSENNKLMLLLTHPNGQFLQENKIDLGHCRSNLIRNLKDSQVPTSDNIFCFNHSFYQCAGNESSWSIRSWFNCYGALEKTVHMF